MLTLKQLVTLVMVFVGFFRNIWVAAVGEKIMVVAHVAGHS